MIAFVIAGCSCAQWRMTLAASVTFSDTATTVGSSACPMVMLRPESALAARPVAPCVVETADRYS
jgi:hypothetical protein